MNFACLKGFDDRQMMIMRMMVGLVLRMMVVIVVRMSRIVVRILIRMVVMCND